MLWAVIKDLGQFVVIMPALAQTTLLGCSWDGDHAQFLISTRPLDRQISQFHAAGEEN
jgi:hypothetical protein